eukprot:m.22097 g.22097  ORF g.22097 m.22097 type:complete len:303 (+) comp11201_c0_seq1:1180-2088(+)
MPPKSGLVCLVNLAAADRAQKLFAADPLKDHALVAVPLPLPTERTELKTVLVQHIPAASIAASIAKAGDRFVSGVGVNPIFWKWLCVNIELINETAEKYMKKHGKQLALLSNVEPANHKYGYPNCDLVGFLGIKKKHNWRATAEETAFEAGRSEAKVDLAGASELFETSEESTFYHEREGQGRRHVFAEEVTVHLAVANCELQSVRNGKFTTFEPAEAAQSEEVGEPAKAAQPEEEGVPAAAVESAMVAAAVNPAVAVAVVEAVGGPADDAAEGVDGLSGQMGNLNVGSSGGGEDINANKIP